MASSDSKPSEHTLSAKISAATALLDAEGTDITRADLLRWYAHVRELEDNLELMRMTEGHLAKYSSGYFKRAEAAEAKLKAVQKVCGRPVIDDWSKQAHDAEMAARVDEIESIIDGESDA